MITDNKIREESHYIITKAGLSHRTFFKRKTVTPCRQSATGANMLIMHLFNIESHMYILMSFLYFRNRQHVIVEYSPILCNRAPTKSVKNVMRSTVPAIFQISEKPLGIEWVANSTLRPIHSSGFII